MERTPSADVFKFVAFALVSIFLCAFGVESLLAGEEQQIDGVLHVINGSTPQNGSETVVLEEMWCAGGDPESDSFFGLITRVVCDENGTIYLLDPQQQIAHVYSADGEALAPFFGPGEGPGEVGRVCDMCFTPDGSLAVLQMSMRTLVKVGHDGIPVGDVEVENKGVPFLMPVSAVGRDRSLVLAMVEHLEAAKPRAGTRRFILAGYRGDGTEIVRYIQKKVDYDYENMVFDEKNQFHGFMWSYAVGPDGRVYALEDRGRLWVRHSRSDYNQPEGVLLTLDVFDTNGHFDKQVSFRAPGKGLYNGFFFVGDDRVLVVKGFVDSMRDSFGGGTGKMGNETDDGDPGVVEVICYRISGTPGFSSN